MRDVCDSLDVCVCHTSQTQTPDTVVVCTFASAFLRFKEPNVVVVWAFASATFFNVRMVYVIGAGSLRRAIDKVPTSTCRSFQGNVFAVPRLGFHATANNLNKQLRYLLKKVM